MNPLNTSSSPIGLFDSGVGGLTVMQEIMRLLPQEQLIYFGDTARIPYGNKSQETIIRYAIENTILLLEKNIKLLVVACNTASAFTLSKLRQLFKLPIIGVIKPGAEKAASVSRSQRMAVLGTKGTIQSGAYQEAILRQAPQAILFPVACPLFVPLVEEQWLNHPSTQLIVQEYLRPLHEQGIDTVLLGCTHYPLLKKLIQHELGEEMMIVDSASTCAEHVQHVLQQTHLLSSHLAAPHQFFVSDDPDKFQALGKRLFDVAIEDVTHIV